MKVPSANATTLSVAFLVLARTASAYTGRRSLYTRFKERQIHNYLLIDKHFDARGSRVCNIFFIVRLAVDFDRPNIESEAFGDKTKATLSGKQKTDL